MTRASELWQNLRERGLVSAEMPELLVTDPWYVKLMQGFAGWFAGLFMLGAVGGMFGWLFRFDNELLLLTAGLVNCVVAYVVYRLRPGVPFFDQLALAVSVCGQFMVAFSLFEFFSDREIKLYLILALFQFALAYIMPSFVHRVLSTWFGMIAFFFGLNLSGIFGLGSALAAMLFTLLWILEPGLNKQRQRLVPIGYGLALSLVHFSGHAMFGSEVVGWFSRPSSGFLQVNGHLLGSLLLSLACLVLLAVILREQKIKPLSGAGIMFMIAAVLLLTVSYRVGGVSSALLVLLVGFQRQRIVLIGLGIVALISFISWYYYNMQETLLVKAYYLLGLGSVLLCCLLFLSCIRNRYSAGFAYFSHPMTGGKWLALVAVLPLLVGVNYAIYKNERQLREGQTVLLELAPVDPRSLMQGDYMRLRYKIQADAFSRRLDDTAEDGHIVVSLDEHQVARFVGLSAEVEAQADQQLLRYRIRNGRLKFATNAFFFQEGSAEKYQQARYGVFKVSSSGDMLLYALKDKAYVTLGVNAP